jgi:hypothetical protein
MRVPVIYRRVGRRVGSAALILAQSSYSETPPTPVEREKEREK